MPRFIEFSRTNGSYLQLSCRTENPIRFAFVALFGLRAPNVHKGACHFQRLIVCRQVSLSTNFFYRSSAIAILVLIFFPFSLKQKQLLLSRSFPVKMTVVMILVFFSIHTSTRNRFVDFFWKLEKLSQFLIAVAIIIKESLIKSDFFQNCPHQKSKQCVLSGHHWLPMLVE